MRVSDIKEGAYYWDRLQGVRKIEKIESGVVKYKIYAARKSSELVFTQGRHAFASVIGLTCNCLISSFATWAKEQLTPEEAQSISAGVEAAKIKLSPSEKEVIEVLFRFNADAIVELPPDYMRGARGLHKKGLCSMPSKKGEVTMTPLGKNFHFYKKRVS